MHSKKRLFLALLLFIISCFCLAASSTLVKKMGEGISAFQVVFLQNLFGLIVVSPCIFSQQTVRAIFKFSNYFLLFLRALFGVLAFLCIFIAIKHVSVASATLLFNTAPFFIPFILLLFFQERIDHRLWLGIIPGFIGIALILHPGKEIFNWHALLPLFSGMGAASIFILVRQLHHRLESTLRMLFYLFLFSTFLMIPLGLWSWSSPSLREWVFLMGVAAVSFLSQVVLTLSLRYASAKVLTPFCYTSVLFAAGFDWWLWKQVPSWVFLVGAFLIIGGGVVALWIENLPRQNTSKKGTC